METTFTIEDGVLTRCEVHEPKIILPDGIRAIDYSAFHSEGMYGPTELEEIILPESVVDIPYQGFSYCKHLRKVTILGPAKIGPSAFTGCDDLEEVYLADGVQSIGARCFEFCDKLRELYIPESVEEIGYDIAQMNDSSYIAPVFICYSKGPGERWDEDWNLSSYDSRFGRHSQYTTYHPTLYGMLRSKKPRPEPKGVPVRDMPHGTGDYLTLSTDEQSVRMRDIRLRLCLRATKLDKGMIDEYRLDEEEKQTVANLIQKGSDERHPLDEPWEIMVNSESGHLLPDAEISAWINSYGDIFDGKTLIVHHDMPMHLDPFEEYPVSLLTEGQTVVAEKYFLQNNAAYDVRLFIEWPEQEQQLFTVAEAIEQLRQAAPQWAEYNDEKNEIAVELAHGTGKAELFKRYQPSVFPDAFIADLRADKALQDDLTLIQVQPYSVYEVCHSCSDDYRDAAEAYGEDCSDWYTTERSKTGNRLAIEIQ